MDGRQVSTEYEIPSELMLNSRKIGITLPSKEAQVSNIRSVYESAGLDFDQTAYVECHGTGTQAGDWRELKAISETLASCRKTDQPIVVGSIKPNIGHLEGAAGIAGLIKGVLTLEHGKIPPNINFERGNPDIDFEEWKVTVPKKLMDWPKSGLRRVSVNCFGFGGTNAHVIMDEAPEYLSSRGLHGNHSSALEAPLVNGSAQSSWPPQIFCFSSNEKSGVQRVIDSQLPYVSNLPEDGTRETMPNYAYTLGCRRSRLEWKTAVVASSPEDLASQLRTLDDATFVRSSTDKAPPISFIFCGQGAQWAGMGMDLMVFDVFAKSLEDAGRYMKDVLGCTWDLLDELGDTNDGSRISDPELAQPATTALQVAMVELLDSLGVKPQHVVGHSSGEIAAAFAGGALSRESAWAIAYFRGKAAALISERDPTLKGGMLAVAISAADAEVYTDRAQVACVNSPDSVTLSGSVAVLDTIAKELKERKILHKMLPVSIPYHSRYMQLVQTDYQNMIRGHIKPASLSEGVAMYSSVSGTSLDGEDMDEYYWAQNLVSTVQYVLAVEAMMAVPLQDRPGLIVEISPRNILESSTTSIMTSLEHKSFIDYNSILRRNTDGVRSFLDTLASLWTRGLAVDLENVIKRQSSQITPLKCLTDLPPYPWNHLKTYWHESHLGRANRFREFPRQDLIGAPTADSIPFEPRWRGFLRVSENPWIQDHQVQKTIIYPASGMVSMVLEGAQQMAKGANGLRGYEISDMDITKPMIIPTTAHGLEVALNIRSNSDTLGDGYLKQPHEFAIYSKQLDGPWEHHTMGKLQFKFIEDIPDLSLYGRGEIHRIRAESYPEPLNPRQMYEHLDTVGMNYGPLFQNITYVRRGPQSCVSEVRIPDTGSKMPAEFEYPHLLHPATLDSMFQTLFAIEPVPMVPTSIESLFVSSNLDGLGRHHFSGYSTAHRTGVSGASADIIMNRNGCADAFVAVKGLHLTKLATSSTDDSMYLPNHRNLCTEVVWDEDAAFGHPTSVRRLIDMLTHKSPALSILQVGGDLDLSRHLLDLVCRSCDGTPRLSRFTIGDIPEKDIASALLDHVNGGRLQAYVEKKKVDGSEALSEYDLIILCAESGLEVDDLWKHLRLDGHMVSNASVRQEPQGLEQISIISPLASFSQEEWPVYTKVMMPSGRHTSPPGVVILVSEEMSVKRLPNTVGIVIDELTKAFVKYDYHVEISLMLLEDIKDEVSELRGKVVISLLEWMMQGGLFFHWRQSDFDAFHALQDAAKGILWLTPGSHMEAKVPTSAPVVSLARTLMSENPLKTFATLDLCSLSLLNVDHVHSICNLLVSVYGKTFLASENGLPREMEYAEKDGKLYIPRLATIPSLNQLLEDNEEKQGMVEKPFSTAGPGLKLVVARPGLGDNAHYFTDFEVPGTRSGHVLIDLQSAAMSSVDYEVAMGHSKELNLGLDVCGVVRQVGNGAVRFEKRQRVVALVSDGSCKTTSSVDARFVAQANPGFIPSFFVSAFYAMFHLGRCAKGRKALIHAGAGGQGLAAIQLALLRNVEVFATVMGPDSEQQKNVLLKGGLDHDHILDANSGYFVTRLLQKTGSKGVDVLYNPTQEHIDVGVQCVRSTGIIVQFQNRAAARQPTAKAPVSGAFVSFDLASLLRDDSDFVADLFCQVLNMTENDPLRFMQQAQEVKEFDISNLKLAFKHIEESPYLGYVELVAHQTSSTVPVLAKDTTKTLSESIDPHGTYLLVGGLGGLGRSVAELLIANGARHLAFFSRSGASSSISTAFIKGLQLQEVNARAYSVDICDYAALLALVTGPLSMDMPPVKGVFQCAAVIKDAVFDNMTYGDWCAAFRPKSIGATQVVTALDQAGDEPFFIFLASSAGVIGNRGQANYAAGNGFQDALARFLALNGRHAVSIDLGPVLGAGMLAEDEKTLDMLRASGFYGIRHQDFLTVVEHAITGEIVPGVPMPPQVTLGVGTGGLLAQNKPADPYWSRTALYSFLSQVDMPPPDLTAGSTVLKAGMKSMLATSSSVASAAEIVCTGLKHMLAKAMNMLFEEMDENKPPNAYGVDSLVAVGVRNWVWTNCAVEISVFEVLSDKTIMELSGVIAEKGGYGRN